MPVETIQINKKNREKEIQDMGMTKQKKPIKKMLKIVGLLLVVAITGIAIYSSWELYKIKSPTYQKQMLEQQTKDIINAVGKLIELPSDTPQIATVTNVDALKKDQPFFDNSKNGDQILIFQKEVILYRPSTNKIINVGPIISTPSQTVNQQTKPVESTPPVNNKK